MGISTSAIASIPQRLGIEGQWLLTQQDRKISIPATVPGIDYSDLLHAKLISDPYYGNNLSKSEWVGDLPWTYSRSFTLSPSFVKHHEIVLRCEGLDTLATITINGKTLAQTNNMF